jgi:type IV secretory pathway VirB4 component
VGYFAQTWDRAKGEPTLSDFIEGTLRAGTFTDDEESHRIAKELCRRMNMFYGNGGYAPFTDGRNTLTITKALTIIEQSELEEAPDLKGILFFAIMHLLTEFYTDPEKLLIPKYFFSDENWSALQTPATARVIVRISRTFRKLNTSAWFLSQLGEDFNSPAGRILRANARLRMFLMQAADERDIAADLFKLTPTEVGLYEQVQRHDLWSTAYLQMPQATGGMLRIVPDLFVRLTVSQHPRDRARRDAALAAHGGNMRAAITQLVQEELAHVA